MFGWPFTIFPLTHAESLGDLSSETGTSFESLDNRSGSHGRGAGSSYFVAEIADITYISIGIVPNLGCRFQQSANMRDLMMSLMTTGGYSNTCVRGGATEI